MADGFLSEDGIFYEKTETYHAETARRVLGDNEKKVEDPIRELVRLGYITFIEFKVPGAAPDSGFHSDLDYVICGHDWKITKQQEKWIQEHAEQLTRKQQFQINDDTEHFGELIISDVRICPECEKCAACEERRKWCVAEVHEEPERCRKCLIPRTGVPLTMK